jgi:hypothetical protein
VSATTSTIDHRFQYSAKNASAFAERYFIWEVKTGAEEIMVTYRSALKKSFLIFQMAVIVGSLALLSGCGEKSATPSNNSGGMGGMGGGMGDNHMNHTK